MGQQRRAGELIAKVVAGALARDRFARVLSIVPAFGLGVVYLRTIAYTTLVAVQFGTYDLGPFLVAAVGTVFAATLVLLMFSWTQLRSRAAPALFFHGTPRGRRYLRRLSRRTVLRPVLVIVAVGYCAVVVSIVVINVRAKVSTTVLSIVGQITISGLLFVSYAGVSRARKDPRGLAEITSLALALLAFGGPDFRVQDEQVHAVFFFHQLGASDFPGYLLFSVPAPGVVLVYELLGVVEAAVGRGLQRRLAVRGRTVMIRGGRARDGAARRRASRRFVLFASYIRRRRVIYWFGYAALSAVLSWVVAPAAVVAVPAAVATVVWLVRANSYLVDVTERWIGGAPPRRLIRQVAASAGLVFLAHAAVLLATVALTRGGSVG